MLYILQNLGPLPHDTLLVTYDVASLYTNIPLAEAERSVARMLVQARPHDTTPSNQSLLKLLRHVFQGNIFTFSDGEKLHYYLQVNGVSMDQNAHPRSHVYLWVILKEYTYLICPTTSPNLQFGSDT